MYLVAAKVSGMVDKVSLEACSQHLLVRAGCPTPATAGLFEQRIVLADIHGAQISSQKALSTSGPGRKSPAKMGGGRPPVPR